MSTAVNEIRRAACRCDYRNSLPDGDCHEMVEQIRSMAGGDEPPSLYCPADFGFLDKALDSLRADSHRKAY